jgi:hypothetical protein
MRVINRVVAATADWSGVGAISTIARIRVAITPMRLMKVLKSFKPHMPQKLRRFIPNYSITAKRKTSPPNSSTS